MGRPEKEAAAKLGGIKHRGGGGPESSGGQHPSCHPDRSVIKLVRGWFTMNLRFWTVRYLNVGKNYNCKMKETLYNVIQMQPFSISVLVNRYTDLTTGLSQLFSHLFFLAIFQM